MAENIRKPNTTDCLKDERTSEIVAECRRQEESCLYTSTTLYIWLRQARLSRRVFVVAFYRPKTNEDKPTSNSSTNNLGAIIAHAQSDRLLACIARNLGMA